MRDVTVVDDEAIQLLTSHLHYYSAKRIVKDLSNKAYNQGRSSVKLPDVCSTLTLSPGNCSNPNTPVGVEVIYQDLFAYIEIIFINIFMYTRKNIQVKIKIL